MGQATVTGQARMEVVGAVGGVVGVGRAQLGLERRTYLVSTLLGFALAFQVLSLFLLVYAADAIAPQLTGAMCAAGGMAPAIIIERV